MKEIEVESDMSRLRLGIAFRLSELHSQAVVLSDSTIIIIRFFCRRVPDSDVRCPESCQFFMTLISSADMASASAMMSYTCHASIR